MGLEGVIVVDSACCLNPQLSTLNRQPSTLTETMNAVMLFPSCPVVGAVRGFAKSRNGTAPTWLLATRMVFRVQGLGSRD